MMALLAKLGAPRALLGALAAMDPQAALSPDDRRFLEGPVVVHETGGWHRDLPAWLHNQVGQERSEIVYGITPELIVGPSELVLVMQDAVMSAPLHADVSDLYCWATAKAAARHRGVPVADIWASLDMRPVSDADVLDARGSANDAYRRIARSVREKVVQAQAERERGAAAEAKAEAKAADAERAWGEAEHLKPEAAPKQSVATHFNFTYGARR